MKRRLRQGAKLIVVDPRAHRPGARAARRGRLPPAAAARHQRRGDQRAGARDRHRRAASNEDFVADALRAEGVRAVEATSSREPQQLARGDGAGHRRAGRRRCAAPRGCMRPAATARIYYGLGVTEHSQGSTMVMGIANLAMATGNLGREGVGVNPLRGQNNVQGSCDMGSFPHELPGYRHVSDARHARAVRGGLGRDAATPSRACASRTCSTPRSTAASRACTCQGEDIAQSDPNTQHVAAALSAMECVVVQDLFLNETAKYAHVFLPGSSFLEKDGTFTNAERRISRVRKVMPPLAGLRRLGSHDAAVATRSATRCTTRIRREIMDEIARADADLRRRELREARSARQHPVAVQRRRRPTARRSCTSTSSCAARASSSSPSTCRPTRRSTRSTRCC